MRKVISISLIAVFFILTLTGCSGNERIVKNALDKLNESKSLETQSQLSVKMEVDNLDNFDPYMFPFFPILSNFTMSTNQKMNKSDDNTTELSGNAKIDLDGISFEYNVWTSQTKSNTVSIIKIPSVLSYYLPKEYMGKKYFVFDQNAFDQVLNEYSETKSPAANLQETVNTFYEKLSEIIDKRITLFSDLGFSLVEKTGNTIDNALEYKISLNDSQLKLLLRYLVVTFGNDKEFIDCLKDYVIGIDEYASACNGTPSNKELIREFFDYNMFLKWGNAILDAFQDVTILGDNGLQLSYYIDKSGNLQDIILSMDLQINSAQCSKAFEEATNTAYGYALENYLNEDEEEVDSVTFRANITYIQNIVNTDNVTIEIPTITEENSVQYADILKQQKETQKLYEERWNIIMAAYNAGYRQAYYWIYINNEEVPYSTVVLEKNDHLFIPLRTFGEMINAEISWDSNTDAVSLMKNNTTVSIKPNSNIAFVNGQETDMGEIAPEFCGRLFVPLRFITETLNGTIELDEDYYEVYITIE